MTDDDDRELSEAIDRLKRWSAQAEQRLAEHLLEQVEARPEFLYAPDTEHPFYAQNAATIRHFMAKGRPCINIAKPPPLFASFNPEETYPGHVITPNIVTLTVKRASGPAPYVGKPFVYVWDVAMDEHNRWVGSSSPARIQYLPEV